MTLPNYFLADLPPEATITPAMIEAACETLIRNRHKFLVPRKPSEIIDILCEVAAAWLRPDNKFRRLALDSVEQRRSSAVAGSADANSGNQEASAHRNGFSAPIMARGIDDLFRQFTPPNFRALLDQDLGPGNEEAVIVHQPRHPSPAVRHVWHGPQFLVHFAAGNIPNPAMMSLTLGLLTRSAQFMKCASGASLLPRLFAHSIYEMDPKLGACLELAEWRGGNGHLETALLAGADCVTATGSDETLVSIRSRLPSGVRFLGYGQRVSVGLVTREMLRDETVAAVVSRVADDLIAWDQNGCLSPQAIYVEERGAVESDKFAGLLAAELMSRELTEPRGIISVEESALIASRRSLYETLAAHRGDVKVWQSQNSTAWTVVFEHELRFHFSPLNRFVFVKPVANLEDMLQGMDEMKGKVSTVGVAAGLDRFKEVALQLARWGVTRVCPAGQMQKPPLAWRHDGRPALGDLITWTDLEIGDDKA